jgi:hypothetical protein
MVDLLLILELRVARCCSDNGLLFVLPPTPPPDEDQITEAEAPADDEVISAGTYRGLSLGRKV